MKSNRQYITVFEHQTIRLNQKIGEVTFDEHKLNALQSYYGNTGVPYYTLIHNGVCFNEYVGVIQIGETVIEVLPKADLAYDTPSDKKLWRNKLIEMLYAVGIFDIQAPSSSSLKLKSNCILDLYFELFITQVQHQQMLAELSFHHNQIKMLKRFAALFQLL
jgi:5-methylcytosine-specific restriction enzyme subunit McrC